MVNSNNIHVMCSEGRWLVMQEGINDPINVADNVSAAIVKARAARKGDADIIVHNRQM
jgi:hypothetical protein